MERARVEDDVILDVRVVFRKEDADLAEFIRAEARRHYHYPHRQILFLCRQAMEAMQLNKESDRDGK